jgi:hypothetical protein
LEAKTIEQKEKVEKREKILIFHLKEITNDLNHLEAKFIQQERKLEDEIITLKIQLEEAKRIEEVMRNQMLKKEYEVEKLEEVVMLRVEVVNLNKNIEEAST